MSDQQRQVEQEQDEQVRRKRRLSAATEGDKVGIHKQHSEVSQRKYNPGFYKETADLDADTEMYPWLENELGAKASRAHVLGNRPEEFVEQQGLLNRNLAERMISEREPGRLLKKNPSVLAVWQGIDGLDENLEIDDPDFNAPITHSRERRQYRALAELLTTRESLAVEGRFVDALTKATTETQVRNEREEEKSGVKGRVSKFFG